MSVLVAVVCEGIRLIHAEGHNGVYATLCGLDGNDGGNGGRRNSSADQETGGDVVYGEAINCQECLSIIRHAKKYRPGYPAARKR